MAKAFLEAKQLSSALPHCPLEHSSETLHSGGSNYRQRQKKLSTERGYRRREVTI